MDSKGERMTEEFTFFAVCPRCHRKLNTNGIYPTYKQNCILKHELFRKLVYECKYCGCELEKQDFIRESVNIKGVENMDINNLTESEQQDFYRLLKKMEGEEPDKKHDVKVRKPQINERYYIIDNDGSITPCVWFDNNFDRKRWELGNVFFTKDAAEFAREKRKVEVELERYAEEHNTTCGSRCYCIRYGEDKKMLLIDTWATAKIQGTVMFATKQLVYDAIEAVGKDRILKYIFMVESDGE